MPPKTQFNREQVVETAFQLLREEGPDAITARRIANRLGSSVGPIYSQFDNIEELSSAAVERAIDLMHEYTGKAWTDIPFLNMGVGFVCFARDEPVLFNTCCREGASEIKGTGLSPDIIKWMRRDGMLTEFTEEELSSIYMKLSLMAYGMGALASQGAMEDDSTETITRILYEAGGDIMFMTKARSMMKKPGTTEDDLIRLWGYVDET